MPPMRMPKNGSHARAKKGTLPRLLKMLFKNYKWQMLLALICIVLVAVSNFTSSIFVKNISNTVTSIVNDKVMDGKEADFTQLIQLLIIMGSIYIVGMIASFVYNLTMGITTQKFLNTIRKEMFGHMETLPIKYFDTHAHGDIMSIYTNDTDTIRQLVSQSLPSLFQTSFTLIALLCIMLYYSLWLTIVVLFGSIFMVFCTKTIGGKSAKFFVKQQKALGKVEGSIEESINGLKVIKVFCHEEKSIEDFNKLNDHLCEVATVGNINGNVLGPIIGNIGNILYVLIAVIGGLFIMFPNSIHNINIFGQVTEVSELIGIILSFLMMARMFSNNINQFSQQVAFIVMGMAGASRVFELLDEKSEVDDGYVTLVNIKYNEDGSFVETDERTRFYAWKHPHKDCGQVTYTELKGDIILDKVDFGYVPEKIVLKDVSIYAHPGQKIAFVGATGAGKTTITNLINRFYDIADGKIRYDGININKIKKSDLRRSLGIVLQDTNLFTGTVMDNIRYGRLDATDEEVYEAAKIANAYDFITRLPQGFNTMLSGDGANLSQGQRQLLSIARAAVADAPVMILDEATSSIDTRTEKLVQQGTDMLMKGRTVFVIAHRLSTVMNSDAIMVLEHGRIIERGSHDDLIKQKGKYYQLYTGAFELE